MKPRTYRDLIAENLRHLRQERDLRQDALAATARAHGLAWTQQTVAAIEAGRRAVSLGELLLLQSLLELPLGELLPELLMTDEAEVEVEGVVLSANELGALAAGQAILPAGMLLRVLWPEEFGGDRQASAAYKRLLGRRFERYGVSENEAPQVTMAEHGDAERKAARRLQVEALDIALASWSLWGHSLTEERDRRMQEQDSQGEERARRGHVTRQLLDELRQRIGVATRRKTARRKT